MNDMPEIGGRQALAPSSGRRAELPVDGIPSVRCLR